MAGTTTKTAAAAVAATISGRLQTKLALRGAEEAREVWWSNRGTRREAAAGRQCVLFPGGEKAVVAALPRGIDDLHRWRAAVTNLPSVRELQGVLGDAMGQQASKQCYLSSNCGVLGKRRPPTSDAFEASGSDPV